MRGIHDSIGVALGLLALACSADRAIYDAALPGTGTGAELVWLGVHDGYLDVEVETAGKQLRFLLREADPECTELRNVDSPIQYRNSGPLGQLQTENLTCEPVGLLSLAEWRSRQRRRGSGLVPRAAAAWSQIYRDDDWVLVRGRFTLASRLGWAGSVDTVALFEPGPVCDPIIARGVGTLVFYYGGRNVLALLGNGAVCPLLGLAIPLDPKG